MAIYDEQEGEVEVGPCMLGATTLMAQAHRPFSCLPCGYRTLNSCSLWEVPLQELMPVRLVLLTGRFRCLHSTEDVELTLLSGCQIFEADCLTEASPVQAQTSCRLPAV